MKRRRTRPHRVRRIAKWVGLVVCIVIILVTVGSGWAYLAWATEPHLGQVQCHVAIGEGIVSLGREDSSYTVIPGGWTLESQYFWGWRWWFGYFWDAGEGWVQIPLWVLLVLTAAPIALLWWRDRRRPGHCRKCGYDLTGLTSAKCPECGSALGAISLTAPDTAPTRPAERAGPGR